MGYESTYYFLFSASKAGQGSIFPIHICANIEGSLSPKMSRKGRELMESKPCCLVDLEELSRSGREWGRNKQRG